MQRIGLLRLLTLGLCVTGLTDCGGRSALDPAGVGQEEHSALPSGDGSSEDAGGAGASSRETEDGDASVEGSENPSDEGSSGPDAEPGSPGDETPAPPESGEGGGGLGDVMDCMSCVSENCPGIQECLMTADCRDGILCAMQDCMGGSGPGGFDIACASGCFGGNMATAMSAFQGIMCAMNTCGDSCGNLLDLLGGLGGGGFPGQP